VKVNPQTLRRVAAARQVFLIDDPPGRCGAIGRSANLLRQVVGQRT